MSTTQKNPTSQTKFADDILVIEHTTADGVFRRFRELFWPDMRKVGKLLPLFHQDLPLRNFIDFGALPVSKEDKKETERLQKETDSSYRAMLDVVTIVLSEKYCEQPLTPDEIERGDHLSLADVKRLVEIAIGLAGLEKKAVQPVMPVPA